MTAWPDRTLISVPPLREAEDLASELRRAFARGPDAEVARCDLKTMCAVGGFSVHVATISAPDRHEALLIPKSSEGFDVIVSPLAGDFPKDHPTVRHRLRFRIAHEIAHSFFYDRRHSPAKRMIAGSAAEEEFCDRFASALLVPQRFIQTVEPTAPNVLWLQRSFDVSAQVAGRALALARPEASVVGLLHRANPATNKEVGWRITWSAGSRFLPNHARISSEVVEQGAATGRAEGPQELNIGSAKGRFFVSAAMNKGARQLIVVFTPI